MAEILTPRYDGERFSGLILPGQELLPAAEAPVVAANDPSVAEHEGQAFIRGGAGLYLLSRAAEVMPCSEADMPQSLAPAEVIPAKPSVERTVWLAAPTGAAVRLARSTQNLLALKYVDPGWKPAENAYETAANPRYTGGSQAAKTERTSLEVIKTPAVKPAETEPLEDEAEKIAVEKAIDQLLSAALADVAPLLGSQETAADILKPLNEAVERARFATRFVVALLFAILGIAQMDIRRMQELHLTSVRRVAHTGRLDDDDIHARLLQRARQSLGSLRRGGGLRLHWLDAAGAHQLGQPLRTLPAAGVRLPAGRRGDAIIQHDQGQVEPASHPNGIASISEWNNESPTSATTR